MRGTSPISYGWGMAHIRTNNREFARHGLADIAQTPEELGAAIERARLKGAEIVLITEKDEPRWPTGLDASLPVRVIRTAIAPLDPVEEALRPLRAAAAHAGARADAAPVRSETGRR